MLPSDANCKSDTLGVHDRLASGDSQSRSCKTPRISIKICISWRVGIIQLKVGGWCVIRWQRLHFDWSLKCDSRCAKSHSFFVNVPPDSVVTGRSCPFPLSLLQSIGAEGPVRDEWWPNYLVSGMMPSGSFIHPNSLWKSIYLFDIHVIIIDFKTMGYFCCQFYPSNSHSQVGMGGRMKEASIL